MHALIGGIDVDALVDARAETASGFIGAQPLPFDDNEFSSSRAQVDVANRWSFSFDGWRANAAEDDFVLA